MQVVNTTVFNYDYLIKLENANKKNLRSDEIDYLLSWIIYRVGEFLLKENINFNGLCGYAADLLASLLSSLDIKFYQVNICDVLNSEQFIHVITIVSFGNHYDEMYILDPTYKQFINNSAFIQAIKKTEGGNAFSEELVLNGYFKLTLDNIKIYFDIFRQFRVLTNSSYPQKQSSGEEYLMKLFKCPVYENYSVSPMMALTPSKLKPDQF